MKVISQQEAEAIRECAKETAYDIWNDIVCATKLSRETKLELLMRAVAIEAFKAHLGYYDDGISDSDLETVCDYGSELGGDLTLGAMNEQADGTDAE